MNIQDWITLLFGGGSAITGLGWILERRKRNEETRGIAVANESIEIENERKKVDLYQDMLNDLQARYEAKYKEFEEMHNRKVQLLEDEIKLHKRVIANLKAENTELRNKLKQYANNSPT
ncbi:hypothetical protein [Riemerella anatipestifer]|uniref:hypothetical protein n=1 Tax=Riemerella anatipestifer TaxID=34085 RepID=UPI0013752453|nr:hypothetical protein [Riemerella anatipestifer]